MFLDFLIVLGCIIVFVVLSIGIVSCSKPTRRKYYKLVKERYNLNREQIEKITLKDLEHLPKPVKSFLLYVGVVGTERIQSYTADMTGYFKMSQTQDFSPIKVKQTSYQNDYSRLFYMTLRFKGITIAGLHHFLDDKAVMDIKILDVFKVVHEEGNSMNVSETVTILNDMCLLAPSSLIDPNIIWEEIDEYTVKASFTRDDITISAKLIFNEQYQLINFISQDRYAITDGTSEKVQWSTPITEYTKINGMNVPYKGSAIWNYSDKDFEYIQLVIENVVLNK